MDPMERRNVYVGDSPGMGLGIFAKRYIKLVFLQHCQRNMCMRTYLSP